VARVAYRGHYKHCLREHEARVELWKQQALGG